MTASTPFNYWANNIFAGVKDLISSLHFMSHFIFTLYSHTLLKVFSDEAHMSGSEIDDGTD
jgi:hypothetical protein